MLPHLNYWRNRWLVKFIELPAETKSNLKRAYCGNRSFSRRDANFDLLVLRQFHTCTKDIYRARGDWRRRDSEVGRRRYGRVLAVDVEETRSWILTLPWLWDDSSPAQSEVGDGIVDGLISFFHTICGQRCHRMRKYCMGFPKKGNWGWWGRITLEEYLDKENGKSQITCSYSRPWNPYMNRAERAA